MSTSKRAFVVMPGYDTQTIGAGRGLWRASRGFGAKTPLDIAVSYNGGSLLAQNFNGLWCRALNEAHRGKPVDYYSMIHADVEPEDWWLDTLIPEMEAHDLDVLGVAIAIKDQKGLTSLALDGDDGNHFRPHCRLTLREVHQLPETFTSKDVGRPLLINTGLWACRFDLAWARQVHFEVNDRIVFNKRLGIYQAEAEPEDWYFSRLCHELGLKIGATRKIRADHCGAMRFTNAEPWGSEHFDSEHVSESAIPKQSLVHADGFVFPEDVDGWLQPSEGRALAELARGNRVLEIGSYCGRSTICMAQTADVVHSVDPHDGRATPRPMETLSIFNANLDRYDVAEKVVVFRGVLADRHLALARGSYDLIFIDGDHDHASVTRDIEHALELLAPGGLLAFHDYRKSPGEHDGRWDEGVTRAVDELLARGGALVSTHATVAVVRPPATILEANHG